MSITGLVFLAAYLAGIVMALARHPRYGLYTYLAVFYLHPPSRWWGAFLPDLRWSLLAAIVTLIATARLPARRDVPSWAAATPARLLIVFAIWMWIQNLWALAPDDHLEASVLFTKYIVLFYLLYRLLETPADIGKVLLIHVAGCAYLGWLAYLAPASGRLEGVGGPGIDEANALGMFISSGILCGAMLILGERSWIRLACIAAMPLLLNTLVQSESRGSILGLIAGSLVLFYLKPKAYRWQFYGYAAVALAAAGYFVGDFFWQRMNTMRAAVDSKVEVDSSAESRVILMQAQFRMAANYPFGTGHRGTAVLSRSYMDLKWMSRGPDGKIGARSSHNTYLSALVEQGIPGIVIFLGLTLWYARTVLLLKRYAKTRAPPDSRVLLYGAAAAGCVALVLVAGQFTDYLKTEVQIWMFAILSVLVRVHLPVEQLPAPDTVAASAHPRRQRAGKGWR